MKLQVRAVGADLLHVQGDLAWGQVAEDWQAAGGATLGAVIAGCPWPAVFWECPPTTAASREERFECVLAEAPGLAGVRADPRPFRGQLPEPVNTFWNLGHDAALVAPAPPGDWPHLAAFCRSAPVDLQQALWAHAGTALLAWWASTPDPVWLSTSGLGVAWLHLRLDQRPKYYTHERYLAVHRGGFVG